MVIDMTYVLGLLSLQIYSQTFMTIVATVFFRNLAIKETHKQTQ